MYPIAITGIFQDIQGTKIWYKDGHYSRENGPAIKYYFGENQWYLNGKLHCLDGPAIEWKSGRKYWYIDGIHYSKEEYHKKIREINGDNINDY